MPHGYNIVNLAENYTGFNDSVIFAENYTDAPPGAGGAPTLLTIAKPCPYSTA